MLRLVAPELPSDRTFDDRMPEDLRACSGQHWTPLAVAARAAEWLDAAGARTVVDVGCGAGKFCVAVALAGKATVIGFEQRAHLVAATRDLAADFGVADRVSVVHGALGSTPLPVADAYYLFNPFGENLFDSDERVDDEVELGVERYVRDIITMERYLDHAPIGTLVITYNGFGGRLPEGYVEERVDHELPRVLRMSRKVADAPITEPPPSRTPDRALDRSRRARRRAGR